MLFQQAYAQELNENSNKEQVVEENEITENNKMYVLPELSIDAERATFQALMRRPQDEIGSEKMQALPTHNPVTMLRSHNSSVTYGTGLAGATVTPRVRGLPSKYAAVTVDGVPINTPYWWNSPSSGFPVSRLKKITLSNTGS
ncbi:MAG: Plug domain-containing protein, partial [Candidatus Riflebacteria bacterium]|nr:Plug domain-containing protein [Candidatus Riflebacteria bacterium]